MKIDKNTILISDNINLRIPSLDDIPFVFSATRHDGFNDGMLWNAPNKMEELVEPYHQGIKSWEDGTGYGFSILDRNTLDFLGKISIRKTEIADRWNIGFWTHPAHQQKGIMTEAVSIILKFGFDNLNANIIEACHAIWNKGSEKVLKRNGMKFIKYIKEGYNKNGIWVDENMLAIERLEWLQHQKGNILL